MGITGMSQEEAENFMAMAGGDIETAMSLFFSLQEGGGGGGFGDEPVAVGLGWDLPDWYTLVWPNPEQIPDKWSEQGLAFEPNCLGIAQPKNGPCGVLAVVEAVVTRACRASAGEGFGPNMNVTDEMIAAALAEILLQCRPEPEGPCYVASWAGAVCQSVVESPVAPGEVEAHLLEHIASFKAAGGAVLLVYSAVLTRTVAQVRADIAASMGQPPLIVGATFVCSMDLMALLLRGVANGNISAYSPMGGARIDWPEAWGWACLWTRTLIMNVCASRS